MTTLLIVEHDNASRRRSNRGEPAIGSSRRRPRTMWSLKMSKEDGAKWRQSLEPKPRRGASCKHGMLRFEWLSVQQAQGAGLGDSRGAVLDAELAVQIGEMPLDGGQRNSEALGELPVVQAIFEQGEQLKLPGRRGVQHRRLARILQVSSRGREAHEPRNIGQSGHVGAARQPELPSIASFEEALHKIPTAHERAVQHVRG